MSYKSHRSWLRVPNAICTISNTRLHLRLVLPSLTKKKKKTLKNQKTSVFWMVRWWIISPIDRRWVYSHLLRVSPVEPSNGRHPRGNAEIANCHTRTKSWVGVQACARQCRLSRGASYTPKLGDEVPDVTTSEVHGLIYLLYTSGGYILYRNKEKKYMTRCRSYGYNNNNNKKQWSK